MGWRPGWERVESTTGKNFICDGKDLTSHELWAGLMSRGSVLMELEESLYLVMGNKRRL